MIAKSAATQIEIQKRYLMICRRTSLSCFHCVGLSHGRQRLPMNCESERIE